MGNYKISLSIVTYNSEKYISQSIDTILENTKNSDFCIYIIDNGSTDRSVEIIKSKNCSRIVLIENKTNIGFGKGHNMALKAANSKYHFFVNPDIVIKDDVIYKMSQYFEEHEDVGVVTPKILYPDGRLQLLPKRNPRFIYLVARRLHFKFLKRYREEYEMISMGQNEIFDIEFCTGSFMAARTDVLKKVGGFDERYFMYFEDADLTREIRKYARAQYNPNFVVYHDWERAGSKQLKYMFIQIGSMILYKLKWTKGRK